MALRVRGLCDEKVSKTLRRGSYEALHLQPSLRWQQQVRRRSMLIRVRYATEITILSLLHVEGKASVVRQTTPPL